MIHWLKGPVIKYGGSYKREGGGQVKFYPYKIKGGGGADKVLAKLKEAQQVLG